ncbi:family 43 glycosylhydrolase [Actinomycetes bacterium KLBMP 9797]
MLNADWSDPDVIRVGDDFYLVASSFHRVPGLPILHSRDLVAWSVIGHALARLEPEEDFRTPRPGCGVWAPAVRHHDGRFWIFYPDPDRGIFVVTATDPAGPWSRPRLLKGGRGLIDPCPLWDGDGSAYLVHAWAKSRAGFNNRLTAHRMSPDGTEVLDEGRVVVDGDALPGYRTLEGPKWYRRDGWYWIFAPAGGVATGWQSVFRSRDVFGPYEDRIVLAQGATPVNGPHQGAWVTTAAGEDWFLHFQDRGPFGRVVHLQPMRWRAGEWPGIGAQGRGGTGEPVPGHARPRVRAAPPRSTPKTDDASPAWPAGTAGLAGLDGGAGFAGEPGLQWTWAANPRPGWSAPRPGGGLRLACVPADGGDLRQLPNVLGWRLPADKFRATVTLRLTGAAVGARAGLTVLGATYAWIGVVRTVDGAVLVHRTAAAGESEVDAAPPVAVPLEPAPLETAPLETAPLETLPLDDGATASSSGGATASSDDSTPASSGEGTPAPSDQGATVAVILGVDVHPDGTCQFRAGTEPVGPPFAATPGRWVGATLGIFATGPSGAADFSAPRITG